MKNDAIPRANFISNFCFNSFTITASNFRTNITIYPTINYTKSINNPSNNVSIYIFVNICINFIFDIYNNTTSYPNYKSTPLPTLLPYLLHISSTMSLPTTAPIPLTTHQPTLTSTSIHTQHLISLLSHQHIYKLQHKHFCKHLNLHCH